MKSRRTRRCQESSRWSSHDDRPRHERGAWKVRRRTIVLDANVLLDKNLSVFL
jgi:hypothetical protein